MYEGSDTELKCVQEAQIPESKNYGFPVKLWLSLDNSVKSGFQCWIPWIPSRFHLDSETSVRDSGVCRTPRVCTLKSGFFVTIIQPGRVNFYTFL